MGMLRILLAAFLTIFSWLILVGTGHSVDLFDVLLWCCPAAAVVACWRAPRLQLTIVLLLLALISLDIALALQTHDCCAANGGYDGAGEVAAFALHQLLGWISIVAAVFGGVVALRQLAGNATNRR